MKRIRFLLPGYSFFPLPKILLYMKLTTFLLLISLASFATTGYSQVENVTVKLKDSNLKEFFSVIEKQTSYKFLYRDDAVEGISVNIDETDKPLDNILSDIFVGSRFSFKVMENNLIVIAPIILLQQPTITGTVTDNAGVPLPGVNVILKGTLIGTITDLEGRYSINTSDRNGILVFTFIGYSTQEIEINGRNEVGAQLAEELTALNEVVVTALGIRREVKRLGYATATVTADQISVNREVNLANGLQGKLAGVNISTMGTGPAGSSKIRIRGQSSFSAQNSPLIVINGVPMDNTNFAIGGGNTARSGQVNSSDGGDGFSSINADDIESMTVLKGATASALYGSRAKDGVIMITTKTRGTADGFGITYNVNYTEDTALDYTDFQYEYGQGERGVRPTTPYAQSGVWSFGEKFEPGMTQVLFDGNIYPYVPVYDRYKKFYDKGKSLSNTLTISNSGDKGGFSLSLANSDTKGIMPGSKFNRRSVNLGFIQNISKNFTASGNVNYSNETNTNPPQVNTQDMAVPTTIATLANSMPFDALKEHQLMPDGSEFVMSRFLVRNNPYFSLNHRHENIVRDRLIGNLTLKYQLTDWLYIQGRIAQDMYTRNQDYNIPNYYAPIPPAPTGFVSGSFTQEIREFRERNYDFLVGSTHKISDFGLDMSLGGNTMYRKSEYASVSVKDFVQPGLYTIGNGRVKDPIFSKSERQVNSFYGLAEFSYKSLVFLSITGRNDWFSTLSPENRSIFYPSATLSFIFSDAIKKTPEWISFGKLRLAYAEVGDDNVAPYSNVMYYSFNSNLFPNPLGQEVPIGGINTSTISNPNLRPLRVSESEVGIDLKLFNNKVGLDMAYYYKLTKDQILAVQVSNTSGFNTRLVNIGESMNQGVEVLLNVSPVKTNSFEWKVDVNVSYNNSKVLKLGLTEADTMISFGTLRYVVGKPIGSIYTYLYLRDDQGNQVFDEKSGKPMRQSEQSYVGDALPKYFGGVTNTFSYKGVTLRALVDFKLGAKMRSESNSNYLRHGLHKTTLTGREEGYVIGVGVNPDGGVNTTKCDLQPFYETQRTLGVYEDFIFPSGFWKLRQVSLGYDFTKHVSGIRFVKGLTFSVVANNVLMIKKWTENMDPENVANISDNAVGSDSWTALPPTRSIGFNLNLKF